MTDRTITYPVEAWYSTPPLKLKSTKYTKEVWLTTSGRRSWIPDAKRALRPDFRGTCERVTACTQCVGSTEAVQYQMKLLFSTLTLQYYFFFLQSGFTIDIEREAMRGATETKTLLILFLPLIL